MTVGLTIFSHKIKICVLFGPTTNPTKKERSLLFFSFFICWGGGGGGSQNINWRYFTEPPYWCHSKEHTQSTNKSKMKKIMKYIIEYLKINTHPFLLFFFIFKNQWRILYRLRFKPTREKYRFKMANKWFCFVWFDYLRPSQQFFSFIGTGLPGLN